MENVVSGVVIVDKKHQVVRGCTPEEEEMLEEGDQTPRGAELLREWKAADYQLRCPCGWLRHIQARDGYRTKMNPGQREQQRQSGRGCWMCGTAGPSPSTAGEGSSGSVLQSLLLHRLVDAQSGSGRHILGAGVRPETAHSKLMRWMDAAGWNRLPGLRSRESLWDDLQDVLRRDCMPVGVGSRVVGTQLSWLGGRCVGGPDQFGYNVWSRWPVDAEFLPEIWAMAFVQADGKLRLGDRTIVTLSDLHGGRHSCPMPTTNVPSLRTSGPYLVLLAGAPAPAGAPVQWYKAAVTAVASLDSPVPVDSAHERDVVRLLQRLGIRFLKPLRIDGSGYKPDFVLVDYRVVLEVQGMHRTEYIEQKLRKNKKMMHTPTYRRWKLMEYKPNQREVLRDLEARLVELVGTNAV